MLMASHFFLIFQRVKFGYGASLQQTTFKVLWNLKLVCLRWCGCCLVNPFVLEIQCPLFRAHSLVKLVSLRVLQWKASLKCFNYKMRTSAEVNLLAHNHLFITCHLIFGKCDFSVLNYDFVVSFDLFQEHLTWLFLWMLCFSLEANLWLQATQARLECGIPWHSIGRYNVCSVTACHYRLTSPRKLPNSLPSKK